MIRELRNVRGLLIDLGGVVFQGNEEIPGSTEAVRQLTERHLPFRFLTNTTSRPKREIVARLANLGLRAEPGDIFTPVDAARRYIVDHDLNPHFLISPELREEFADLSGGEVPAVIVGDAGEGFTYQSLNRAFRKLEAGAELIALASNRKFIGDDGLPCLDAGAFVAALEYASGKSAVVLGKPAAEFFHRAVDAMQLSNSEVAMIGDDAEFDVSAAVNAGLVGILVQTGKYRPGATDGLSPAPTAQCADLGEAVDRILQVWS